jgi:hypothetical protein
LELVIAQVQRPKLDEAAEARRYLTDELVAAEVELPEKGQVSQER